jgi:hypothetical protein
MSLEHYRTEILKRFTPKNVIGNSVGDFKGNWDGLAGEVDAWWKCYKAWEAQDTVAAAFREQRLTVKGTTVMDQDIEAREMSKDPNERYKTGAKWGETQKFPGYKIVKTNASIMARLNPKIFMPSEEGESQKTEKGYHDLSALLLNPNADISVQQYKGRKEIEPDQVYVFMPLSHALDQAVFQNINMLAKAHREKGVLQKEFYNKVRNIRSKMTRIKLIAEHDMSTSFVMVGRTESGRPRFKYTLIGKTDISQRDVDAGVLPQSALNAYLDHVRLEDAMAKALPEAEDAGRRKKLVERLEAVLKSPPMAQPPLPLLFAKPPMPPEDFRVQFEQVFNHRGFAGKFADLKPKPTSEELASFKEHILAKVAGKTRQVFTTPGIYEARQRAAINFQSLVLGEMMRYAEVTIAYRRHKGKGLHFFPKFARFDKQRSLWIVGTVNDQNVWTANEAEETFPDRPV